MAHFFIKQARNVTRKLKGTRSTIVWLLIIPSYIIIYCYENYTFMLLQCVKSIAQNLFIICNICIHNSIRLGTACKKLLRNHMEKNRGIIYHEVYVLINHTAIPARACSPMLALVA